MHNFNKHHSSSPKGTYVVPLLKRTNFKQLGKSRKHAVCRFLALGQSLTFKQQFQDVDDVYRVH